MRNGRSARRSSSREPPTKPRFMQKIYGDSFMADMRQAAAMIATTPAFARAMKKYNEKQGSLDGSPIRLEKADRPINSSNLPAPPRQSVDSSDA